MGPNLSKSEEDGGTDKIDDLTQAKTEIFRSVTQQDTNKYFYTYSEYIMAWFLKCCCSRCFKDKPWYKYSQKKYERHAEAVERLDDELDIVQLVKNRRKQEFSIKLQLARFQRRLVDHFSRYVLPIINKDEMDDASDMMSQFLAIQTENLLNFDPEQALQEGKLSPTQVVMLQEFIQNFDPEQNEADKAILFEITGQQYHTARSDDDEHEVYFYENYHDYERGGTEVLLRSSSLRKAIADSSLKHEPP